MLLKVALLLAVTAVASWPILQPRADARTLMNQPFTPFRVIGNIYYVGMSGVSSFLIATPNGSVLIDAGYQESPPRIVQSITRLGFRVQDIKYLLSSHVHNDHVGGMAEMKRLSGAAVVMSSGDAPWLERGGPEVPPVRADRVIRDGDVVQVGDTTLTARVTPGHTPGCTTWTTTVVEEGRPYRVVFYCSTGTIDTGRIVGKPRYANVLADYERTFRIMRDLPCDVFLHVHPDQFDMVRNRAQMRPGAPNPFVDPSALRRHVEASEREFRQELARQQAEL